MIIGYLGLAYKLLVLVGVGLLFYSLRAATLIVAELPSNKTRRKWHILRGLVAIFIVGYMTHALFFTGQNHSLPALITSVMFFLGACFVMLVNSLSLQTVKDVKRIAKLEAESVTDQLTGVYNRRGFFTLAEQLLKTADRQRKSIFMLYADVDGLKTINDTYGHLEGDRILIETAEILKKNYRDSDIIGRLGGDEFVVIPVGTAGDDIDKIAARFHSAVRVRNEKTDSSYTLSVSIGIAHYEPDCPCSIDELMTRADKLMYEQKRQKKQQHFSTSTCRK